MKVAYFDQPYLGCCGFYEHFHGDDDGRCWDEPDTHRLLIERACDEFPDGWAMSLSAPSLKQLLAFCPDDVRTSAWCKTWHQIRPKVPVQHAWEPVFIRGGRERPNNPMVRDWLACSATRLTGTVGAKPYVFCAWLFDQLGLEPDDEFVDVFAGSGAVTAAWEKWRDARPLAFDAEPYIEVELGA